MPATKCGGCAKFLSPIEGATCNKCDAVYHRACVGLPKIGTSPYWRCPECTKNERRDNKMETPVRGRVDTMEISSEDMNSPVAPVLAPGSAGKPLASDLPTELRLLKEELCAEFRLMRHEVQKLRAEMTELKESLKVCNDHMSNLDTRVEALELRLDQNSSKETSVDNVIAELRLQLNEREQEVLLNDVEVNGIPEAKGEP